MKSFVLTSNWMKTVEVVLFENLQSVLNDPKIELWKSDMTKRKTKCTANKHGSQISLKFTLRPTFSHFRDTGNFETTPNNPKMALSTKRSKVLPLQMTTTSDSQISISFALRWSLFWVTSLSDTGAPDGLKMTLNTKLPQIPKYNVCYKHQDSQILIRFALLPVVLELHAILRQMHQNWHKHDLEH